MKQEIIDVFPVRMRDYLKHVNWEGLEEIRVRIGWPIELVYDNRSMWLGNDICITDRRAIDEMLNYISGYSLYSMEEELKQGFLTLQGGHRVGVTGKAAYDAGKGNTTTRITVITDISALNIRVAHEKKGCAKELLKKIRNGDSIYNTILFSAPGVGKTTYLRDLVRLLSSGEDGFSGLKCSVIDERSEIAACHKGKPQNDLGSRVDVLDACPKELGMRMVLRSMSPRIIVVDELGKEEEFHILEQMRCSGVKLLGTMHAGAITEIFQNPMIRKCVKNGSIERFVELFRGSDGRRGFCIYDGQGRMLWKN